MIILTGVMQSKRWKKQMTERMQQERVQFFSDLFEAEAALFDHWKIPEIRAKGTNRVVAVLPLNSHKFYGETVLSIQENYGEAAAIREYRYAWELQDVKGKHKKSKQQRHITSFDKQPHPKPPRHVKTDPFHHHHIPQDPVQRTSTSVESLEEVITIFQIYIGSQKPFLSSHTF